MAFLLPALAWLGEAIAAAGAEGTAVAAAEAAEATAAAVAEATAAAEAAAAEAAATAAAAEEAAAAEAVAAEAATAETEAGLEATVKAEEEAVGAAEKAAELGAKIGARIGAVLGEKLVTGLNGALTLLKGLMARAGDALLFNMAIQLIPTAYRKIIAGWLKTLAAAGIKLVLVAFKYMGLSGGSEEGEKVAKEAKKSVDELHEKARKLLEDSPSKVPIYSETHAPLMEKIKQHIDSDKEEMEKMTALLDGMDHLMQLHMENNKALAK